MLDTRHSSRIDSYFNQYNAQIKPDWRLHRANWYSTKPHLCPPDHFTQILVYMILGDERRSNYYGAELAGLFKQAFKIRNSRFQSLTIESRLLAYPDSASVAKHCGIAEQIVQTYADAFFDVQPRIHARGWIRNHVIDEPFFRLDVVRRQLYYNSYFRGPKVVEHWLKHLPYIGVYQEHDLETTEGREREKLEIELLERSIREPLSPTRQQAYQSECLSSLPDYRSVNSILRDSVESAMQSATDERELSLAFTKEIDEQPRAKEQPSGGSRKQHPTWAATSDNPRKSA